MNVDVDRLFAHRLPVAGRVVPRNLARRGLRRAQVLAKDRQLQAGEGGGLPLATLRRIWKSQMALR